MRGFVHRTWHPLAFVVALGVVPFAVAADITTQDLVDQVSQDMYYMYMDQELYTHAGDDRGFGPEHDLARQNILDRFASYGLDAYLDPFEAWGETWYNVVGVQLGTVTPDQIYIIGAHYDSVDNPGADDNASGTAGVMEVARVLSQYEFESTIVYLAFDREEQGLIGSDAYAEEHEGDDIRGMVSMDMIAYNTGADSVDIEGRSASNPIKNALAAAVVAYGGLSYAIHGQADYSNHAPFEWRGWQACLIIEDWGNPYYHTQNDNMDMPNYLDFEFATKVTKSVTGWLADAAVLIQPGCAEDIDGSGAVDFGDVLAVLAAWGNPGGPEDLDESGTVDFADLLLVLAAWGPCE